MKPTVLSLVILVTVPCAGQSAPSPPGMGIPSTGGTEATSQHVPEVPSYRLPSGRAEISGLFGGNVYSGALQANPSLGGKFVFGLAHGFGVFAEGSWNRVFGFTAPSTDVGVVGYNAGGGLQWTPFRLARFAPYMQTGLGWVRLSVGGHVGPHELSFATDRLGANLGFGARVYLNRGYGLIFEVGALQGPGNSWVGRFSMGLFYQFK